MRKTILLALTLLLTVPTTSAEIRLTEKNIDKVISRMTLEEKARMVVGDNGVDDADSHCVPGAAGWTHAIPRLGIPSINLADGPVGVRINPVRDNAVVTYDENGIPVPGHSSADPNDSYSAWCTAFPSTTALAATWNTDMATSQGVAMGDEAQAYGVDIVLTPGINIMRNPLCGRNFEYYSEDPVLTGMMASAIINGIQSRNVGTSLKHFVANNQQTGKKYNDARMTQRALREIYLKAFEICISKSNPWTVMGSYNKIAGDFTQTNRELMIDLLRDEWGWDGLVLTDWYVPRPKDKLLNARSALIMPGDEEIVQTICRMVNDGTISMKTLDACVRDVLKVVAKSLTAKGWEYALPDLAKHAALSRRMAAEAMVLLKNDGDVLPAAPGNIALFGTSAYQSIGGGTGSSNVNKRYVTDICTGLERAGFVLNDSLAALYKDYNSEWAAANDKYPDCPSWQRISYHRPVVPEMDLAGREAMIANLAKTNGAAVVVLGRPSGETSDRKLADDYNITDAERRMLTEVSKAFRAAGKPVIVVLNVCGAMEMGSWLPLADAVLMAWFPGQECGDAVADVLSGKAYPSGRMPLTVPVKYEDNPSAANYPYIGQTEGRNFDYTNYEEDIWVGYRYFDKAGKDVVFPFGYGLGYTEFGYSNPVMTRHGSKCSPSVTVTNVGNRPGKEVVQLYFTAPADTLAKPKAELLAFAKTPELAPGESCVVTLDFDTDDLASFDEAHSRWITAAGDYTLRFGHLSGTSFAMPGDAVTLPLKVNKKSTRKVKNILAPVEPVETIKP